MITETDESFQSIGRNDEYQLPDDYINTKGKLDKKRKLNALNAKDNYDDKMEKAETTKRNRYENQWELDQLKKAQIANVVSTDEINLLIKITMNLFLTNPNLFRLIKTCH